MTWAYEIDDGTPSRPIGYHYAQYATRAEAEAAAESLYGPRGSIRRVPARDRFVMTYHDGNAQMTLCPSCAWLRELDYDDDMNVGFGEYDARCDDCDEDDEGSAR